MNNIASCFLRWLNDKGYYSRSYGKNYHMPEIAILVYNCGGKNKNNVMFRFLNMIKEGGVLWDIYFAFLYQGSHKE